MKQIDDRACLNSTQPQLEGLTRCLTALVALSDDMSDDLSCRTYYQSARCMENLHADPNCDIEAFDNVIPDYVTTALMRTPDLLASLSVTSLPPAPKCSDYIKKAVDIKAPCLDKEFFGKYVIGRVCRKYVGHVLIEEVPKFTRCQYIVECGQTAMYEVFHANCTVEQVQDAINSTSSELQTLLPLAADSCEEDSCSQILSKPEGLAASTKCFTYMYLQNTSLLTLEENCNFVLSGFACLRGELWKYNVSCPIRGLAQHYFSYVRYLASQNTTIFPFDITQCAAIVEKEGDEKIEDLCSNEDLIPLFVSTSYCALHSSSNDCSVLNGLVSCVKSSLNCSDVRPISNALITRSDVLVSRLGRNYSGCPADGGAEGSCSTMLAKPEGTAAGAKCFTYMFVQNTSLLTLEENCNFVLSGLACLREEMYKLGLSCTIRGLAQDYFNYIRLMASLNITIFPFDVTKCAAIVAKEGDGKIEDLCSNEELIPLFVSTSYCAFLAYSNDCGVLKGVTECVQSSMNCSDGSPITNALISRSDVLVKRLGKDYSKCPKEDKEEGSCSTMLSKPEGLAASTKCFTYMFVQNTSLLTLEENCNFVVSGFACLREEMYKLGLSCTIRGLAQDYFNYIRLMASLNITIFPFDITQCEAIVAKEGDGKIEDLCSNEELIPLFVSTSYCAFLAYSNDCGVLKGVTECVQSSMNCSDGSPITNALISRSDVLVKRLGKDYSKCPKEDEGGKKCPEQSDVDYSIAMDVVAECGAILGKFNASIIPEEHACRIFWGVVNCTLEELSKKGYDKCEKEIVEYVGNYLDTKNKTLKDVVPYNYKNCHFNKPTGDVCSNSGTLSYFAASSLECAPNTAVLIRKNNYTCGSLTFLVECVKEVLGKSEMKCRASTLHNNFYYNSYILQKYNKTLNFDNCESYAGNITSPDYYRPCPGLHISSIQC
ncbi:uncharacterized protein LOC124253453 isoform X2 [Haliotis rubra]|uniref:uncharacterized protein LOC124253453 isoform X2 n=1 Tax=Haliotis rubra TaxID=36100 RepID=UPI001EE56159|nr:uncharacterized protein LOC124253453 isoform X2 [Haliotis rubra]